MPTPYTLAGFPTGLGWIGVLGEAGQVTRILIGQDSLRGILQAVLEREELTLADVEIADWCPELEDLLTRFADGEPVELSRVRLKWPRALTPFRRRVVAATRKIPWGQTISYGELARRSGSPGAARAVGTVMSSNRFPLVIPCHRVVSGGGGLGGFTAPRGTDLKRQLLANELAVPVIADSSFATRKAGRK
jgi:methylated-DNA-[protein]-cysteine S-methyltransferase